MSSFAESPVRLPLVLLSYIWNSVFVKDKAVDL